MQANDEKARVERLNAFREFGQHSLDVKDDISKKNDLLGARMIVWNLVLIHFVIHAIETYKK